MELANSTANDQVRLAVYRDVRAIRRLIRRLKASERLDDLCLFGRRDRAKMIDYLDRRDCDRSRVELTVFVTPVAYDGQHVEPLAGNRDEIVGITRDVSRRGLGFTHDDLLEGDYATVEVDLDEGQHASLLLEIRWANLANGDGFISGGRFCGIVDPPSPRCRFQSNATPVDAALAMRT